MLWKQAAPAKWTLMCARKVARHRKIAPARAKENAFCNPTSNIPPEAIDKFTMEVML